MTRLDELDTLHIDVMKEIASIGVGNAATALAKLLNQVVRINVPAVTMLDFKQLAIAINGAENIVAGLLINLSGDINGIMMFIMEEKPACRLMDSLMGRKLSSFHDFEEIDLSALNEIGNILCSSYLSSLSTMTNFKIKQSVPFLSIDMAGAILSVPAIEFGKVGDKVLFIESSFVGNEQSVSGYFILVPDMDSFHRILKTFGVI